MGQLNSQTSKNEEIEHLAGIIKHLTGTQTYLESLLSPALLNYFIRQVKDDFCPDIYSAYLALQAEHANALNSLSKAEEENKRQKEEIEQLKNNYKNELIGKNTVTDNLKKDVTNLQVAINKQQYEHGLALIERDKLAEQITKLKVMLFDLQNKFNQD